MVRGLCEPDVPQSGVVCSLSTAARKPAAQSGTRNLMGRTPGAGGTSPRSCSTPIEKDQQNTRSSFFEHRNKMGPSETGFPVKKGPYLV